MKIRFSPKNGPFKCHRHLHNCASWLNHQECNWPTGSFTLIFRLHIMKRNVALKGIQSDGLCRAEWTCFPSCDFPDSFFHLGRAPGVGAGRPWRFSHVSSRAARSQPCLLTLQSWQIRWIYLVLGGRLNCWFEHGEHSCLSRVTI